MIWSSILSKLSFVKFLRRGTRGETFVRRPRAKYSRLALEILEDRLAPAAFSQSGTIIVLTLNSLNEALQVHATSANHYEFSSTANFTGTVNSPSTVTINTTSATLFTSQRNSAFCFFSPWHS